jgi:hypothetical protein
VVRLNLEYDDATNETIHLARNTSGAWVDLECAVPCEVVSAE